MKNCTTILLILLSTICHAQINLVEHFGNLCALGNSLVLRNDTIHIAGTTCVDIGNNQFSTTAFIAGYDLTGSHQYYEQVGDTLRGYRGEKLLMDSIGNKYILGTFSNDSSNNPTNIGVFVQKRDPNNQVVWTTEYQDSSSNVYYFMRNGVFLDNNKIAICGTYNVSSPIDADILFMVFDSIGNVVVHKRIGVAGVQEEARSICLFDQNRIALGANSYDPPNDKNWVLMLDYQGNVLDEYISASNRRTGVWDIVKTQDGGLACVSNATDGDISAPEYKNYVEKLDSNLNQVWDYTIDGFFRSWNLGTSIDEASNGDIIIGGNYASPTSMPGYVGFDAFLMRLSPLGDSLWHHGYYYYEKVTFSESHNMYDLVINNDRIFFVGDANDFNVALPPGQSLWLVSTDSNGVISNLNERISVKEDILVYPNPARETISFASSKKQETYMLEIFDLNGHFYYRKEGIEHYEKLNISQWPSGIYIYNLQHKQGLKRGKFIKN